MLIIFGLAPYFDQQILGGAIAAKAPSVPLRLSLVLPFSQSKSQKFEFFLQSCIQ